MSAKPHPVHDTSHGKCGKTWKQIGNRTGHCGGCHETFEGEHLFDSHRYYIDEDKTVRGCLLPEEMEYPRGYSLKSINGTWRTTKPSPFAKKETE